MLYEVITLKAEGYASKYINTVMLVIIPELVSGRKKVVDIKEYGETWIETVFSSNTQVKVWINFHNFFTNW